MTYHVKEIFHTLQGEGINAGRPAVFVRFSGCNLWSGREEDRGRGPGPCSAWCDTDFLGTNGTDGGVFRSAAELAREIGRHWLTAPRSRPLVVCTGGEPLLQLDAELVDALHALGFEVAVETNGTRPVTPGVNWVCVSPKAGVRLAVTAGDEIKVVFPQAGLDPTELEHLIFRHFLLQPLDGPCIEENTRLAIRYCLEHPQWRLSVQTHKALGIR